MLKHHLGLERIGKHIGIGATSVIISGLICPIIVALCSIFISTSTPNSVPSSIADPDSGPFVPTAHPNISSSILSPASSSPASLQTYPTSTPRITTYTSAHPKNTISFPPPVSARTSSTKVNDKTRITSSIRPPSRSRSGSSNGHSTKTNANSNSNNSNHNGKNKGHFEYRTFDPCHFSDRELTISGLSPMPIKAVLGYKPPGEEVEARESGCSYKSSDSRWEYIISKVTLDGRPDTFSWMDNELGSGKSIYGYLTNKKIIINGHAFYTQENTYTINSGDKPRGTTLCYFVIPPGVELSLADYSGTASPTTLCSILIKFARTKIITNPINNQN